MTLGVGLANRGATDRRLSLQLHPDKARSLSHPEALAWADLAFAALVAAYETLETPDK